MANHLQTSQPELHITARDVQIAGLCHDLGHGLDRGADGLFIPVVATDHQPRRDTLRRVEEDVRGPHPVSEGAQARAQRPLSRERHRLHPRPHRRGGITLRSDEKSFLFDIIVNERSGLDVDKFDYIARDAYMMGISSTVPSWRIIHSARVIDGETCINIKDDNLLLNIGASRFGLHKEHKSHRVYDCRRA
uniref:HD domain-containing protein n=1 Tax=Mycena chlorophos TaxID=658473 RepID=A0ABQ0KXI6_MYCCL|nr:predicted protein [Mycena chlorophos]